MTQQELTTAEMTAEVSRVAAERLAEMDGFSATLERLAYDDRVDVSKVEKLLEMFERVQARRAEQAFNVAMATVQQAIRRVATDKDNSQTKSRYASLAAIDRELRPIYTEQGFGLTFDTGEAPGDQMVRLTCLVTHAGGFSRAYHLDMPADGKGAKGGDVMTRTHATGSAVSYGMRYLKRMIFDVAIGEDPADDDGNAAATPVESSAPDGFENWFLDLEAVAEEGTAKLETAWRDSRKDFRAYVVKARRADWERIKRQAAKVNGGAQ